MIRLATGVLIKPLSGPRYVLVAFVPTDRVKPPLLKDKIDKKGYPVNKVTQLIQDFLSALELLQSVSFEGNGYLALPPDYLQYDQLSYEPVLIALAFNTRYDGVLLYQNEERLTYGGDYILLRGKKN